MFLRIHLPTILWAIFILILCGIPGERIPELDFWKWLRPDKVVHLVLFGMQTFLAIRSFHTQTTFSFLRKHSLLLAVLISIFYGVLVEVLQAKVFIHRSGDFRDAIANSIGAFLGLWIYLKLQKPKARRRAT